MGLVTSRLLLRYLIRNDRFKGKVGMVKDVMVPSPITITADANVYEAMQIMREKQIGCLPVVNGTELIGIITEMDFLRVSARLMERQSKGKKKT